MRQALELARAYWAWAVTALLAVQVAALVAMGQPWVDRRGLKLWSGDGITGESSRHIADWYAPSHVLHGVVFYLFLWLLARKWPKELPLETRFVLAVLLEAAWEIFENTPFVIERYRSQTAAVDYRGDTIINSGFDTVWMALGFAMAMKLPVRWIVAIFVAMELTAGWAVRDNLVLNVLTFIWPMQAIVDWQNAA